MSPRNIINEINQRGILSHANICKLIQSNTNNSQFIIPSPIIIQLLNSKGSIHIEYEPGNFFTIKAEGQINNLKNVTFSFETNTLQFNYCAQNYKFSNFNNGSSLTLHKGKVSLYSPVETYVTVSTTDDNNVLVYNPDDKHEQEDATVIGDDDTSTTVSV
ncbi:MAG: hypothetical protein H6909_00570 [Rickettsiaceae bacterium]|nr:hypothetical protein [Rickettsiaceae bacterium]